MKVINITKVKFMFAVKKCVTRKSEIPIGMLKIVVKRQLNISQLLLSDLFFYLKYLYAITADEKDSTSFKTALLDTGLFVLTYIFCSEFFEFILFFNNWFATQSDKDYFYCTASTLKFSCKCVFFYLLLCL